MEALEWLVGRLNACDRSRRIGTIVESLTRAILVSIPGVHSQVAPDLWTPFKHRACTS